jgi:hypothetical protein
MLAAIRSRMGILLPDFDNALTRRTVPWHGICTHPAHDRCRRSCNGTGRERRDGAEPGFVPSPGGARGSGTGRGGLSRTFLSIAAGGRELSSPMAGAAGVSRGRSGKPRRWGCRLGGRSRPSLGGPSRGKRPRGNRAPGRKSGSAPAVRGGAGRLSPHPRLQDFARAQAFRRAPDAARGAEKRWKGRRGGRSDRWPCRCKRDDGRLFPRSGFGPAPRARPSAARGVGRCSTPVSWSAAQPAAADGASAASAGFRPAARGHARCPQRSGPGRCSDSVRNPCRAGWFRFTGRTQAGC